jgi:Ca-activated chloride channel family protein
MSPIHRSLIAALSGLALTMVMIACVSTLSTPPDREEIVGARIKAKDLPVAHRVEPAPQPVAPAPRAVELAKSTLSQDVAASAPMAAGMAGYAPSMMMRSQLMQEVNTEKYAHFQDNPIHLASTDPVSTFSVDVDTGAYANVRRMLLDGGLPPEDAVRTEEFVNYFGYDYPAPESATHPFSLYTEVAPTPWNPESLLLHIGIKGYAVEAAQRPAANLVFLIDVSGSMQSADKLELAKPSLRLLAKQLKASDRVTIVVYAGASGLVLPPTPGDRSGEIIAAVERLQAGGSTNGGDGIRLAYDMAKQAYIKGGINRVLLLTDGDFNVGTVSFEALLDLVKRERASGVTLTTLGFGSGNYNDQLMEQLADVGNGNYAYIDSLKEARKVLVEGITSTLQVIAGDVKAQIEFNPALVAEYRLIGYENRVLRREDFNNDKVDAGDIGAGHTVTALYEIKLVGSKGRSVDDLRYGEGETLSRAQRSQSLPKDELAFLKLRYKLPGASTSQLVQREIKHSELRSASATSTDFRFAAAVAAFGQRLRGGDQLGGFDYKAIETLAQGARGKDPRGERAEFLSLIGLAAGLAPEVQAAR